MPARRPPQPRPAFTLLELTLVLLVIAIALGTVAPQLRGYSRGTRLRDAADDFVTLTRMARTRAVATATVHRIVFDAANRRCVVAAQSGQQFIPLPSPGDDAQVFFPDAGLIRLIETPGIPAGPRDSIDFYPNGRAQAARVRITADDDSLDVEAQTPAESFRVLRPEEARR